MVPMTCHGFLCTKISTDYDFKVFTSKSFSDVIYYKMFLFEYAHLLLILLAKLKA